MGTDQLTALIRSREGAECLYKEGRIICVARIPSIKVDDRGINAALVPVPTPGLNAPEEPWTSGSRWEIFSCDADSWTCACSGLVWRVFFDTDLIREVKELGQTFSGKESEQERFEKLIKCIKDSVIRRLKAGQPKSSAEPFSGNSE